MVYKFLLKDLDGFSHPIRKDCPNDDAARLVAQMIVSDTFFVDSVVISRENPNDPDGFATYVDEFRYE